MASSRASWPRKTFEHRLSTKLSTSLSNNQQGSAPTSRAPAVTTLVTGPSASAREQAIAAAAAAEDAAILLEGMPSGHTILPDSFGAVRIAPGCLCCSGNLVLRVTLNRLLRRHPRRLFIGVASTEHLDQLRSWLAAPPYDQLLTLTPDLVA